MELLQQFNQSFSQVVRKYYFEANQTQKYWARDNKAALKIQSKFRMFTRRKAFLRMKQAAIRIQTAYRGFAGRRRAWAKQLEEAQRRQLAFFGVQATIIQKMYRGFYTRKYGPNFYKRKQELEDLRRKNEQFKIELDRYALEQQAEEEKRKEQIARAQFTELARNLHHLTSTKTIPGVYNSPYADIKPAAFNIPVQKHLKEVFTSSYKWKPPNRDTILKHTLRKT